MRCLSFALVLTFLKVSIPSVRAVDPRSSQQTRVSPSPNGDTNTRVQRLSRRSAYLLRPHNDRNTAVPQLYGEHEYRLEQSPIRDNRSPESLKSLFRRGILFSHPQQVEEPPHDQRSSPTSIRRARMAAMLRGQSGSPASEARHRFYSIDDLRHATIGLETKRRIPALVHMWW